MCVLANWWSIQYMHSWWAKPYARLWWLSLHGFALTCWLVCWQSTEQIVLNNATLYCQVPGRPIKAGLNARASTYISSSSQDSQTTGERWWGGVRDEGKAGGWGKMTLGQVGTWDEGQARRQRSADWITETDLEDLINNHQVKLSIVCSANAAYIQFLTDATIRLFMLAGCFAHHAYTVRYRRCLHQFVSTHI